MTLRILLPLYRIEVSYLVRRGRRWSALEHLVLWACESGTSTAEIAARADVPPRLVSEALVNLLRAGWVDIRLDERGATFRSTGAGRAAAAKEVPDKQVEIQKKTSEIYMERLTGEFFGIKDITVVRRDMPGLRPDVVLQPRIFAAAAYGPELVPRLPLRQDESFEGLGRFPQTLPGDLYAVLEADEHGIYGLPSHTPASVGLTVRQALEEPGQRPRDARVTLPPVEAALGSPLNARGSFTSLQVSPDDLVVGGPEHLAAAKDAIGRARRIVVIHSTFVGKNLKHLLPALEAAAGGGAQVHLHWGRTDDPERIEDNPSAVAARLAVTELSQEIRRNIHLGTQSTDSHAKILIADAGVDGGFVSLVGSCNWLDSPFRSVEASFRTTNPELVGALAKTLAALLAPLVGRDVAVGRLLEVSAECGSLPRRAGPHRAMIVADEDHYAAVRDAMNQVGLGGTVLLGSHKFGHAAETTVFDPMRAAAQKGARVQLYYTRVLPNLGRVAASARQTELLADAVQLQQVPQAMHAKFIAWKDSLLITSFNFLSASVNASKRRGSEIGVLLDGPDLVAQFKEKLSCLGVLPQEESNVVESDPAENVSSAAGNAG